MLTQAAFARSSASFDPSTLTLSGWWRASYTGSPWVGVGSAGSSGSRNLTEATNPPATGAAVNSLTPADFDGSNDRLLSATAASSYVSDAAGSVVALFFADTALADAGAAAYYSNPGLFMNSTDGYLGVTFSLSGVRLGSFDTTSGTFNSVATACGTGAWHLAQARWNSTTLEVRVDSGSWQTLAKAVSVSLSAGGIYVGTSYSAANFFDGKILEVASAQTRFSDAQFDNIKSYVNARYALSL